ncbi:PP2C family protein-serine/threonine phosphatase [Candidatus Riflebacteria bacterium]
MNPGIHKALLPAFLMAPIILLIYMEVSLRPLKQKVRNFSTRHEYFRGHLKNLQIYRATLNRFPRFQLNIIPGFNREQQDLLRQIQYKSREDSLAKLITDFRDFIKKNSDFDNKASPLNALLDVINSLDNHRLAINNQYKKIRESFEIINITEKEKEAEKLARIKKPRTFDSLKSFALEKKMGQKINGLWGQLTDVFQAHNENFPAELKLKKKDISIQLQRYINDFVKIKVNIELLNEKPDAKLLAQVKNSLKILQGICKKTFESGTLEDKTRKLLGKFLRESTEVFGNFIIFERIQKRLDKFENARKNFEEARKNVEQFTNLFTTLSIPIDRDLDSAQTIINREIKRIQEKMSSFHKSNLIESKEIISNQLYFVLFLAGAGILLAALSVIILVNPLSDFTNRIRMITEKKGIRQLPEVKFSTLIPIVPFELTELESGFNKLGQDLNKIWEKRENRAQLINKIAELFSLVDESPAEICSRLLDYYKEKQLIPPFLRANLWRQRSGKYEPTFSYPEGVIKDHPTPPSESLWEKLAGGDESWGILHEPLEGMTEVNNSDIFFPGYYFFIFAVSREEIQIKEPFGLLWINFEDELLQLPEEDLQEIWILLRMIFFIFQHMENFVAAKEKGLLDSQLLLARKIQLSLIPEVPPKINGVKVDFYYEAAMEVGGDYVDFIQFTENEFAVCVADVSGKNISAALLMSVFRSIVRTLETPFQQDPEKLMSMVNRHFCRQTLLEDRFITFFYVIFSLRKMQARYCCAGHNPMLLFKNANTCEEIRQDFIPVGIIENYPFKEGRLPFQPGDRFYLYTDGITEAKDQENRDFGLQAFKETITNALLKKKLVIPALKERLKMHLSSNEANDDISLVEVAINI